MPPPRLHRSGLTPRAAAFLATGAILLMSGLPTGWRPVAQLGIFLLAMPFASLATVAVRRDLVSARRLLGNQTPQLGEVIQVVLAVTPQGGGLGPIMVADSAPAILGGSQVAAISGVPRQYTTRHRYQLVATRRGRHVLGPAWMIMTDRFGLVARGRQIADTTELVVVPRIHPLAGGIPAGASSGSGWGATGAPGGSHDDLIPRDYRPGDELRRVDWRATARTGALMVRSEEQPWRACLLIVLDRRERSHRGPAGADSLEAALSLVASVGAMALASGWDLRVVDLAGATIFQGDPVRTDTWNTTQMGLRLAALDYSIDHNPDPTLAAHVSEGAPVLAVLGENPPATVARVAELLSGAHPAMAAIVAAPTWSPEQSGAPGPGAEQSAGMLRRAGWRVGILTAATTIPDLWIQIQSAEHSHGRGAANPRAS